MKSTYHQRFWLRLAEAIRCGWGSLLIAAPMLYVQRIQIVTATQFLAPVLTILLAGPPLGTVLQNSVGLLAVTLPTLASTVAVLQIFKPPISKLMSIVCTGVTSSLVAYLSGTHIIGRKLGIAQASIIYITAHYSSDIDIVLYPLKIIASDVLGVLVAIIATLVPFPRLVVWEVRESAKSAARGASESFKAMVRVITASDASTFGSLYLHSRVLTKAAADSLAKLKATQVDVSWELGSCGGKRVSEQFTKGLNNLNLHLTGMQMGLESGHVLDTPLLLRGTLQGTLQKMVEQTKPLLDASAAELLPCFLAHSTSSSQQRDRVFRHKLVEEGKNTLNLFDLNYLSARQQAYYSMGKHTAHEFVHVSKPDHPLARRSVASRQFRGRVSMLFFLFNLRLYLVKAIKMVSTGRNTTDWTPSTVRLGSSVPILERQAKKNNAQQNGIPNENIKFDNDAAGALGPSIMNDFEMHSDLTSDRRSTRRVKSLSKEDSSSQPQPQVLNLESPSPDDNNGPGDQSRRLSNSGPSTSNFGSAEFLEEGRCHHRYASLMEKIKTGGRKSNKVSKKWKLLRRLGIKPSKTQFKRSMKISVSMILATFFGYHVLEGDSHSFWAPVTVGFLIGSFQGGSWRSANLRLQGTVLGAIFGFLALSVSQNYKWKILSLLVPWVIFSAFVRSSPNYGYAGLVSAFTAPIIMLGGNQGDGIKQLAMNRITETFIGILCFVFVETVVFPERAVFLVRQELISALINLRDSVGAIVTVYTEHDMCLQCRSLAMTELKLLEQRLRASFAQQSVLSKEAALEPDLWFVPFPAEIYAKLIAIQGRMVDLLFFMVCSLDATMEDCLSMVQQLGVMLKPLRASLVALQGEVLGTIDILQETLQANPGAHDGGFAQAKRWLRRSAGLSVERRDIEQGQGRNHPDPNHPLLVLGHRRRSVDGIPVNLKSTMDGFEHSFEEMMDNLISSTMADEMKDLLSNTVVLAVGALTFSLHSLLKETVHLEQAVHELLQAESPWSVLDFWEGGLGIVLSDPRVAGRQSGIISES